MNFKINILSLLLLRIIYIIYEISIRLYQDYKCENQIIFNKIILNNIKPKLKSGDLVFFKNNYASIIYQIFNSKLYSHIGIIIEIDKELYIYELIKDDYKHKGKRYKGIQLSKLDDRINNYVGNVYISPLKKNLTNKQLKVFYNYIEKNKNIKFGNPLRAIINILFGFNIDKSYYCTELITYLLDEMQISDKKITTTTLHKNSNKLLKLIGNQYLEQIHIIPNELLIIDFKNNKNINMCL